MSAGSDTMRHNATQIRRYLEIAPSFIGPGAPPDEPMGRRHRGASRPPATEKAHDFWTKNEDAARILHPIIADLRRSAARWRATYFSAVLTHLYEDPASVARWQNRRTPYERRMYAAFGKMVSLMAHSIRAQYGPERQISVTIPKRDERAKDWQTGHNRDNNEKRSEEARRNYWIIEAEIERIVREYKCTRAEAIERYQERRRRAEKTVPGVRSIERALAYCRDARTRNAS